MKHVQHITIAAVASGAALLLLSGCTPATPTPTASPTVEVSTTPTPTPTVESISAPEPRIGLDCDALGAALPLATSLVQPVTTVSRAQTEYGAHPSRPEEYLVRSAGGLVCEYSNGQAQSDIRGSNPAYVGVRILVLPDPGAQWDRYVDYYSVPGTRDSYCVTETLGSTCYFNGLGGNRWADIVTVGARDAGAGMAIIEDAFRTIATAAPGAEPWAPPADTLALPDACNAYVTPTQLQSATGLSVPLTTSGFGGGGWSLRGGAAAIDGSPSCFWSFAGADAGIGTLEVLRGGAWAWAEAREIVGSTAITVAGLGDADEAWLRCGTGDVWCVVDLILGGNWVQLHLWEDDPGEPLDRRTAIQHIAAIVVANVGS